MINEGFRGVPGVPDGWELVGIHFATEGVWYAYKGKAFKWTKKEPSDCTFPIIRKIENPKQYRPFADAEEAEPFFDERLRKKDANNAEVHSRYRIDSINIKTLLIASVYYTYEEAFEKFVKSDGTPFGIEVKD